VDYICGRETYCRALVGKQSRNLHAAQHEHVCQKNAARAFRLTHCNCSTHQVLVLSHIGATQEETFPYAASLFAGVPVVTVFGRNAKTSPETAARKCVHFGWRDVLLPLMIDAEFPDDTLFLVFEEDWRLNAQTSEAEAQINAALQTAASGSGRPSPSGSSTDPVNMWTDVPNSRPLPPPRKGIHEPTKALQDIVCIAIQADREGMGDIIWFSWQSRSKGSKRWPARPTYGSTLLGFNKKAATWARAKMVAQARLAENCIDCWLLAQLYAEAEKPQELQAIKAAFVRPTIGCFIEHQSGCQPNIGRRQSQWDLGHVAEGTRDINVPDE
jgi:hypothetical protein